MPPSDGLQVEEAGGSSNNRRSASNAQSQQQQPGGPPSNMSSRKRLSMAALCFILLAGVGVIIGVVVHKQNSSKKAGTPFAYPATTTSATTEAITTTSMPSDTTNEQTPTNPTTTTTTDPPNPNEGTFNKNLKPPEPSKETLAAAAGKAAAGSLDLSKIKLKPPVMNKAPDDNTCLVDDFDELKEAVEEKTCQFITLTAETYDVEEEILVSRSVTISGNPQVMPVLNGQEAERTFRVLAGGFLEVRYAQIVMSEGITRDPYPWEGATTEKVIEIRGGSAYFEPGALGGNFVFVIFIDDPEIDDSLEAAIQQTLDQVTIRVYGGHIFACSGDINFYNVMFYDLTALYPITNFVIIGGDVLNLGGNLNFMHVYWIETTFFGMENGVGLFVANLAGVSLYTFNNFDENNFCVVENAIGQAYFLGGGAQIFTASLIDEFSAVIGYSGTGELTVLGGVSILTGIGNVEAFGIGVEFGAGMEYSIGAGAVVHTGASMIEYNGLFEMGSVGELSFLGTGVFISTGSPMQEFLSISDEHGQGGSQFCGAGYMSFVGSPLIEMVPISAVFMVGEYIAVDAGFLVWIASPIIECVAIEFGGNVIGSVIYVGAGAMVIGVSPVWEAYTQLVTHTVEFWIGGTCEVEGGAEQPDGSSGENSRSLVSHGQRERLLYQLPWFVTMGEGCDKIIGIWEKHDFDGPFGDGSGGGGGGETTRNLNYIEGRRDKNKRKTVEAALAAAKHNETATVNVAAAAASAAVFAPVSTSFSSSFSSSSARPHPTAHLPPQVRRHATNFHRQDRELADQKSEISNSGIGLLAFNVPRMTGKDLDPAELEGLVPSSWIEDLKKTTAKVQEIWGDRPDDQELPPMFHLESKVDGYCGLCGVEGADGPGMSGCSYQEDCKGLAAMDSTPGTAKALLNQDVSKIEYDEHHLIMATLEPTTSSNISSLDMGAFQEAVVTAIAHTQGTEDLNRESVIVNLYTGEPDPQWGHLFPAPKRSLFETAAFDKTHRFKMVAIATSSATKNQIVAAMEPGADGGESPLALEIAAAVKAAQGIDIGHVGLKNDQNLFVPAYNSEEIKTHGRRHLGTHSTMLVNPAQPAVPVKNVAYKQPYRIYLENYPAETQIDLRLLKYRPGFGEEEEVGEVSVPIKNVKTDAEGEAIVKFVFDHATVSPGDYYLQATFPTGEVSYSPHYTISHEGPQRRLYGPFMHIHK